MRGPPFFPIVDFHGLMPVVIHMYGNQVCNIPVILNDQYLTHVDEILRNLRIKCHGIITNQGGLIHDRGGGLVIISALILQNVTKFCHKMLIT